MSSCTFLWSPIYQLMNKVFLKYNISRDLNGWWPADTNITAAVQRFITNPVNTSMKNPHTSMATEKTQASFNPNLFLPLRSGTFLKSTFKFESLISIVNFPFPASSSLHLSTPSIS